MKSILLFSTAILLVITTGLAQDSTSGKPLGKPHTVNVFKTDCSVLKGYLYESTPSGISVTLTTKKPSPLNTITPEQIDKLYLRRKGNVGMGLLLGAIGGTAIGAAIGAGAGASKPTNEGDIFHDVTMAENTVVGATIGFFSGAGLGLIIGALTKKKFIIHGKKENYELSYPAILERAMVQHQ